MRRYLTLGVVGLIALSLLWGFLYRYSEREVFAIVTQVHEYKADINLPEDWGMVRNEDNYLSVLNFKANTGTLRGRMLQGECHQLRVRGVRFSLLSWAPNLYDARQVAKTECDWLN